MKYDDRIVSTSGRIDWLLLFLLNIYLFRCECFALFGDTGVDTSM